LIISGVDNEIRKIQFTGRSTFIISLPKKWMQEMQLTVGDPVTILKTTNGSLSIFPNIVRNSITEECSVNMTENENQNSVRRKVISTYLRGYNVIHIRPETGRFHPNQRDAVREVVNRNLMGAEIIEDSSQLITVTVLMSAAGLSVNTALKRMFLIGISMHRDAISALESGDQELAYDVMKADDEVDRFSLYILRNLVLASQHERLLYEIGLKSSTDCFAYRVVGKTLERIADHASRIAYKCQNIEGNKLPEGVLQKLKEMSEKSLQILDNSMTAFLQGDYYLADKVADESQTIVSFENDILTILNKFQDPNSLSVKLILEDVRRTAEHAADIAEATLNQNVLAISESGSEPAPVKISKS
jgi:phosphate uptake regulator